MNANLTIIRPGPLCTLQDLGRIGFQEYGFTQSGAADEHAFRWANTLLNNPQNSSCLEITMGMFSAKFQSATQICICGANSKIFINSIEQPLWTELEINTGDILDVRAAKSGFKLYLSVKNGFIASQSLGSVSMNPRENMGFNSGQALKKNQVLEYKPTNQQLNNCNSKLSISRRIKRTIDSKYIPNYSQPLKISVIPSLDFRYFSSKTKETLTDGEYRILADSNRMGYRLNGDSIEYRGPSQRSAGVTFGTIQITPDGQPIILLKDHQTIGGYPKIGTVSKLDTFKLSQKKAGEMVSFKLSNRKYEEDRLVEFLNFFNRLDKKKI